MLGILSKQHLWRGEKKQTNKKNTPIIYRKTSEHLIWDNTDANTQHNALYTKKCPSSPIISLHRCVLELDVHMIQTCYMTILVSLLSPILLCLVLSHLWMPSLQCLPLLLLLNEISILTVKNPNIKIESNITKPSFLEDLRDLKMHLFVCDFKNNNYFFIIRKRAKVN